MEIINLEEDCDQRVHERHITSADQARSRSAGQSASDGDTELDGVHGVILMMKEAYLQAMPRVVPVGVLGEIPVFVSALGNQGDHAKQADAHPGNGELEVSVSSCAGRAERSETSESAPVTLASAVQPRPARDRLGDDSTPHNNGSTPGENAHPGTIRVAQSEDVFAVQDDLPVCAGLRLDAAPSVLRVAPVSILESRVTTACLNLRGKPVTELRSNYAGVVSQEVPAWFTSKVSDGKPSAPPDAEGPEAVADQTVKRRCGLHRLPAQQSTNADHTRTALAARAAGMFLAENRAETADAMMVDVEGQVKSTTAEAEEARFEGCADTTTEVGQMDARKYVSNVLPYMDEQGVFWFECHGFKEKEQFLLFYAAHRANERVIRAVAMSLNSSESLQEWMRRLEGAMVAKGQAVNVLRMFVADGIEIWAAATLAHERRKLQVVDEAMEGAVMTGGPSEAGVMKQGAVDVEASVGATASLSRGGAGEVEPKVGTERTTVQTVRSVVAVKPPGILMQTMALVEGKPEIVFNDSGADVSCISTATVKRLGLNISPTRVTVCNPNGTPFTVRGTTMVTLQFGAKEFRFPFQVLDDVDVGILVGDDFLRHFKCTMSYGSGFIEYDGVPVLTVQEVSSKATLRMYRATEGLSVELCEDMLVEVGKPVDVAGKLNLPTGFPYRTHMWTFEPLAVTEAALGITIAPAVVKLESADNVRVRVVGRQGAATPITLIAGTVLGTIHTVRHDSRHFDELRVLRALQTPPADPGRAEQPKMDNEIHVSVGGVQNVSVGGEAQRDVQEGELEWTPAHEAEFQVHVSKILQQLPVELTAEERQAMVDMLTRYKRTLSPVRLGCANMVTVDIDPGAARPVCHPDRRWSPQEAKAIREQVEGLLAAGLVEPSDSPWSSRLVCAPKKGSDGTKNEIRVCVDFRDVNALCVKDAYPAPNIEATLDQLNKAAWYSSIDLAKGYHQVPLTERAKQICSFRCPSGFFRYTRMPFGIMNAPAAFQRMMDVVLRDIAWKFCMVYIDDVIVYSTSWAEHVDHVGQVLQRIQDAGLTVGLKKCHFGGREVAFLGYVVSARGIKPDPVKVAAIRAFKIPATLSDLRSFLGLASQFRKFIRSFGDMARPLQFLTRKEAHGLWVTGHAWTEERVTAFEAIKAAVAEEVTLAHPRYDRPLLMVCDASDYGMGAMLAQLDDNGNERPIAYTSATFYGPALRYTTTEKEGLAVVWAAAHFRPYIHGVPTVVVTDHSALTWILSRGDPPARIAHWVMDLAQYDFTYLHRKGAHNNVADALSRLRSRMNAVAAVNGSEDMPASCVLRTITTRRSKRLAKDGGEAKSSQEEEKGTEESLRVAQNASGMGSYSAESSAQPTLPLPVVLEETTDKANASVMMEAAEGVGCEGAVPDAQKGISSAEPPTNNRKNKSETPPTGFWVEAVETGGRVSAELSMEAVIAAQVTDVELRAMRQFIQNGVLPDDPALRAWVMMRGDEFLLQAGLLVKAEQMRVLGRKSVRLVLAVPKDLRWRVVAACHDSSAYGGHMDAARTCARVKRHFWWSRLYSDVFDYVGGCLVCRSAAKRTAGPAPISSHRVPTRPFEFLGIDLIAMPEAASGNRYAMVVMDHFSRYATVVAIPDKTAATVARALTRHVLLIHGPPETLLSDQGTEFDNVLMRELARIFGFKKISTTPYRPQCDGLVERFNRTLLRLLRCFVDGAQANWDDVLPYVLFSYNTAVSSATGEAPFSIIFGRDPPTPIFSDILDAAGLVHRVADPSEWRREVRDALSHEFMEELADFNRETKEKRNQSANAKRRGHNWFRPGLVVLLANNQKVVEGAKPKLARKQRGLFVVTRMTSPVTAELRKVGDAARALVKVHIDLLEPVRTGHKKVLVLSSPYPAIEGQAEDTEVDAGMGVAGPTESFVVERVVGIRVKDGQLQMKVRWLGYGVDDDSWLTEADLDCPRLVEAFIASSGDNLQRILQ